MDRSTLPQLLLQATAGLRDVRTWRAAGYVIVSFAFAVFLFVASVVLVIPSLVLCIVGIGIMLTVGASSAINQLAGVHRHLAGWVQRPVQRRVFRPASVMAQFRDVSRWRIIGYGLSAWFISLLALVALVVAWALPLYLLSIPLWGWAIESFSVLEIIGQAVVGAGLLLISPAVTQGAARLLAHYVDNSVGPDRLADMERQVTDITASRDEILNAVAGERRRIERNLHDGVQQQLVALSIDIGLANAKLESDPDAAHELLAEATQKTRESIGELRTIGRGLHPAVLGDRGLDAALSAVVSNSTVPIELRSNLEIEPPGAIGEAAYFIISEAVTNVMKHSQAKLAVVDVVSSTSEIAVSIYDDGRGGAHLDGTGLAGIAARVRGLQGTFSLTSPTGGPTIVTAAIPYP